MGFENGKGEPLMQLPHLGLTNLEVGSIVCQSVEVLGRALSLPEKGVENEAGTAEPMDL